MNRWGPESIVRAVVFVGELWLDGELSLALRVAANFYSWGFSFLIVPQTF